MAKDGIKAIRYFTDNKILISDEIKKIRGYYGLSATKESQILGFGVNMYGKYESGEMPNVSNGRMIKICEGPYIFQRYFFEDYFFMLVL